MNAFRLLSLLFVASVMIPRAALPSETKGKPAKKGLHVYLLIGQSNMAGRATIPEEGKGPIERCYLLNGEDEWEPAANPLNRYSTARKGLGMQRLGPGYGFAKAMIEADAGHDLGLVVNARGGSNIDEWEPEDRYYRDAVRRAKIARKSGVLKGILWHQGESNAKDAAYGEKLEALVANLRKDLGMPTLAFVCGEVHGDRPVNKHLAALPKVAASTGCASARNLTVFDGVHFDTKSTIALGERYAERMRAVHRGLRDPPRGQVDRRILR